MKGREAAVEFPRHIAAAVREAAAPVGHPTGYTPFTPADA